MSGVEKEIFKPNAWFSNPNLQTVLPHLFRGAKKVKYNRERFTLSDGDFVDLDWSSYQNKKLCLILHGLESSSDRGYIYGMVHSLNTNGFDTVTLNFRGCGGETNKKFKSYNSGFTQDVEEVITYLKQLKRYENINLIGFSLGGNVSLKIAGTQPEFTNKNICKIATISTPCNLHKTALKLESKPNKLYHDRFLKSLKNKLYQKLPLFPKEIKKEEVDALKTLIDFDDYYTARAFGFKNALDYYKKSSSKQFIKNIKNPTLIITAKDDPFLTPECMPIKEAEENENVTFLNPEKGGHVGFMQDIKQKIYWHEKIIINFLNQ